MCGSSRSMRSTKRKRSFRTPVLPLGISRDYSPNAPNLPSLTTRVMADGYFFIKVALDLLTPTLFLGWPNERPITTIGSVLRSASDPSPAGTRFVATSPSLCLGPLPALSLPLPCPVLVVLFGGGCPPSLSLYVMALIMCMEIRAGGCVTRVICESVLFIFSCNL